MRIANDSIKNAQVTSDYIRNIMELPAQNHHDRIINLLLDIAQGKPQCKPKKIKPSKPTYYIRSKCLFQ